MMFKIGLTGLIGSGKSVAADYFSGLGVELIDTDVISHYITATGGVAIPSIVDNFGHDYLLPDGALDRTKMRDLVFKNKHERSKLELLLHPLIFNEVIARVNSSNSLYVIIVVPLLFQSSRYAEYINRSVFVDCDEETIITRVMQRNGWTGEMVRLVLGSQMPRTEQLKLADDVLDNNNTPRDLELQVYKLHEQYKNIIENNIPVRAGVDNINI